MDDGLDLDGIGALLTAILRTVVKRITDRIRRTLEGVRNGLLRFGQATGGLR